MNKFIFISPLIIVINCQTISIKNQCQCNQLLLESECRQQSKCVWNGSSCSPPNCLNYNHKTIFNTQTGCYYNGQACLNYDSCSDIHQTTEFDCQLSGCYYYSGQYCSNLDCSQYNNTQCQDSGCIYIENQCEFKSQCSQYTQLSCPVNKCKITNSTCVPVTCNDLDSTKCDYVFTSLKEDDTSIQLCQYDGIGCVDANITSLNYTSSNCFTDTDYLYHWSTNNTSVGSCIPCFSLQNSFLMFLTIILLA